MLCQTEEETDQPTMGKVHIDLCFTKIMNKREKETGDRCLKMQVWVMGL